MVTRIVLDRPCRSHTLNQAWSNFAGSEVSLDRSVSEMIENSPLPVPRCAAIKRSLRRGHKATRMVCRPASLAMSREEWRWSGNGNVSKPLQGLPNETGRSATASALAEGAD